MARDTRFSRRSALDPKGSRLESIQVGRQRKVSTVANAASEDEATGKAASEYRPRRNLIRDRDRSLRGDVTRMAETFE